MPRPTVLLPFGESVSTGNIFCVPELDPIANVDPQGNVVERFLDTEEAFILVHLEPGAAVQNVRTSYGTIVNAHSPQLVTRTNTLEEVVFKSSEEEITLPHIPNGGVSATWTGNDRTLTQSGRKIKCPQAPGICDITYSYSAWQYRLRVPLLSLAEDEEFPVDISFEVE